MTFETRPKEKFMIVFGIGGHMHNDNCCLVDVSKGTVVNVHFHGELIRMGLGGGNQGIFLP